MNETTNEVNHPDYYNWLPGVECIAVAEHFNYNLGCVIKYVWRAGRKNGGDLLTDLQKARWYIDREIARLNSESVGDGEMPEKARMLRHGKDDSKC